MIMYQGRCFNYDLSTRFQVAQIESVESTRRFMIFGSFFRAREAWFTEAYTIPLILTELDLAITAKRPGAELRYAKLIFRLVASDLGSEFRLLMMSVMYLGTLPFAQTLTDPVPKLAHSA